MQSRTKSAAFPDPFMMITGSLCSSASVISLIVFKSPSQTMIAIGTGIPVNIKRYFTVKKNNENMTHC